MDSHLTVPVRSRSSQSASPSHSTSTSTTSPIHKHKLAADDHALSFCFLFSDTRDDLECISARDADSDTNDESEEAVEDEERYGNLSMRNFMASRMENNVPTSGRNTKLKTKNSVKIEPSDGGNVGGNGSTAGNATNSATIGATSGITLKEKSAKSALTDNIQTNGAYSAREESLKFFN